MSAYQCFQQSRRRTSTTFLILTRAGSLGINLVILKINNLFLVFLATNDEVKWVNGRTYFRLDGSTPSHERDRLINAFNKAPAIQIPLFLISTRAGSLGINLVGKIFDVLSLICEF